MKIRCFIKGAVKRIAALAAAVMLIPSGAIGTVANAEDPVTEGYSVSENGETAEATPENTWRDADVTGSELPTLTAISPAEFATDSRKAVDASENLYTMTVSTGMNPGTAVEYFAIRYLDANSVPQTKYIFPRDFALKESYDYILRNTDSSSGDHDYLEQMGYTINEPSQPTALAAWSTDEYLFKADTGISKITGVEAFMSGGKWTVQGITVSQVTSVGGFREYGFYSGKYYLDLGKKRICEMRKYKSGTLTLSANGDTLINIGGSNSTYFGLYEVSENKAARSVSEDLYSFRIDLADIVDAGLESLLRNDPRLSDPAAGTVVEDIALEVEYKDINGWTRNVTMPVLLSVLGQYKASGDKIRTIGLAQRGDTLAFTGSLPEYETLLSTRLYLGKAAMDKIKETGGITFADPAKNDDPLVTSLSTDSISLAGVSIYKGTCRMSNLEDGTDTLTAEVLKSYSYTFDFSEKDPLYYYTTTQSSGYIVKSGTSTDIAMSQYQEGDLLLGIGMEGDFLIRLKTSDIDEKAGTMADVRVLLNYQNYSGTEGATPLYDIRS